MDQHEQNKAIAVKWAAASVSGDGDAVRALFSPDCKILIVGDMPFCGAMDVEGFFAQTMLLPLDGPISFEIGAIIAEGDHVWFEAQSNALLKNGKKYRNVYMFQMTIIDGKITEYKEMGDTLHIYRCIDDPAVQGDAIERIPLFAQASHKWIGGSIGEAQRGRE